MNGLSPWPWPEEIGDEAAAHVADCLRHIADGFDNRHRVQINRHYRSGTQPPPTELPETCHERQLHLFGDACPPF